MHEYSIHGAFDDGQLEKSDHAQVRRDHQDL
jgi:hypothetical protein